MTTTKQADFERRVRSRMDKTGESYSTARSQLLVAAQPLPEGPMAAALHVSNGDATDLAGTGLGRRILYWRDVLHEGPVPAVGPDELRRVRARFLTGAGVDDRSEGADMFVDRDRAAGPRRGRRRHRRRGDGLRAGGRPSPTVAPSTSSRRTGRSS
jgi:hypothetical protein